MRELHTQAATAISPPALAEIARWEAEDGRVLGRLLFDSRSLAWSFAGRGVGAPALPVPVRCELLERARAGRPDFSSVSLDDYRRARAVWWSTVEIAVNVSRAEAARWAVEHLDLEDSPNPLAHAATA